jgi:hypothetical protein
MARGQLRRRPRPSRGQRSQEVLSNPPRLPAQSRRECAGGRRRQLRYPSWRDAGVGRRERLRQDDDLALHPARDHPHRGRDPVPDRERGGGRRGDAAAGTAASTTPSDADDLPGSLLLAQSADDDPQHRRRAIAGQWGAQPAGADRPRRGAAEAGGIAAGVHAPLPARLQRRAATADRHRPRASAQSEPTSRSRRSTSRCRRRFSICYSICKSGSV